MLTMRPLPATPYTGPIHSPLGLFPVGPLRTKFSLPIHAPPPSAAPNPTPKRRPHTRRLQSAPSPDLPPVTEEEETEASDQKPIARPKRKPRPTPLIPSRTYPPSSLPLIVEAQCNEDAFDHPPKNDENESFTLSPSTLLARRRSETILDFPVPPSHSCSIPRTSPPLRAGNSPTPSNISLSSTSSAPSSPYPLTPNPSEVGEDDAQPHPEKVNEDGEIWVDDRSPRQPYRSSSVVSLRSFNMAEFDARAESIYTMLHSRCEGPARRAEVPQDFAVPAPAPRARSSPRLVLSVLDTARGGSFNVPLVLGSFLSPPSSPSHSESFWVDSDSDGEGIPTSLTDSEDDDFGSALSSSEDDTSDDERGPNHCLDPAFHAKLCRRRHSRPRTRAPVVPSLSMLQPLDIGPDTPSEYSSASPADWNRERPPLQDSVISDDVPVAPCAPPATPPRRTPSPRHSPRTGSPVLRSRFSTSTLGSLPPQPTSSTQAFFARLAGRVKGSSPTKSERSSTSRTSPRRRAIIPPSPVPSAFSFSTSSRSSLDSTDGSSVFSADSTSSSGTRRPPIPIELFLRG